MKQLLKLTGIAAIAEGLIYVTAFVYFGAFLSYPTGADPAVKMAYLAEIQLTFSMMYFLIYVVFGVLLAVIVAGMYEALKHTNSPAVTVGSLFGVIWVGLVIASGMISNTGLAHAIALMDASPAKALEMWTTASVITESLGGGNELVGGLWVLLMSSAAIRHGWLPRALNYLGCFVGMAGIATIYPDDLFTELFGVSQIFWFLWLGTYLVIRNDTNQATGPAANTSTY